jgi:hypothetical protein
MKKISLNLLLQLRNEYSLIKIKAEQLKISKIEAKKALKIKRILNRPENEEILRKIELENKGRF